MEKMIDQIMELCVEHKIKVEKDHLQKRMESANEHYFQKMQNKYGLRYKTVGEYVSWMMREELDELFKLDRLGDDEVENGEPYPPDWVVNLCSLRYIVGPDVFTIEPKTDQEVLFIAFERFHGENPKFCSVINENFLKESEIRSSFDGRQPKEFLEDRVLETLDRFVKRIEDEKDFSLFAKGLKQIFYSYYPVLELNS